jgi:hypothetical protein
VTILSVRDNIKEVTRQIEGYARDQIPFATALALTRTAQAVQGALRSEIGSTFDKPTPWIMRGTFVAPAKKQNLNAEVGVIDKGKKPQALYMKEHFSGGTRGAKPFERLLQAIGALPDGYRAIPAAGMKLDSYGNPNRRQLTEVVGSLKSGMRTYAGKGKRQALTGLFVVRPNDKDPRVQHLSPGIWFRRQRAKENSITPVFIFVQDADYGKVISIKNIAGDVISAQFRDIMDAAVRQAMGSAR